MHCYLLTCFISKRLLHSGILTPLNLVLYRYQYRITIFQCRNNKTVRFSLMCYTYYYFLGLNRGNEHKSICFVELCKNTRITQRKKYQSYVIYLIVFCTRAHIQSISFTRLYILNPALIQCGLPLLLFVPFPFQSKSYFVTKTTCTRQLLEWEPSRSEGSL